jgi:hypothetical protein
MTGSEMIKKATQELLEERQQKHYEKIKQQLRNIASKVNAVARASEELKNSQEELTKLENEDWTKE